MHTPELSGTDPVPPQAVETRPKMVAQWLARLPFASPADAAWQLVEALHPLNRHPLDANERYALLALYRPVIARVAANLEALLAESGVPPHALQRQIGALLRRLQTEHGVGYKQILLTLTSRRFGGAGSRRTAEVTARLLAALRDIQTACYVTRAPLPAGLWQEMHQLHAFAQAVKLADKAVGDAPTANQAFSQALLFAQADPPHMSHAELVHTRLYLERFATLAVLTRAPVAGHKGFPARTGNDAPPDASAGDPGHGRLWLDTHALCRHLHDTALRLSTGETPRGIGLPPEMESELSQTLCKRLLKKWGGGARRASRRYARPGSTIQMLAGVSAIHRLLDQAPHSARLDGDETDALPIRGISPLSGAGSNIKATRWTVSNDSASGLAVNGAPEIPLNLKVGDPLALRAGGADAIWSLGVIRWIRMRDARQVELGIERLSPQIEPAWVRPLRGHRKASAEPALFVPGVAALQQKDRLLLPRQLYQSDMDAEVWHSPHRYTLSFGRLLEHTASFDLIDFTLIADEQP